MAKHNGKDRPREPREQERGRELAKFPSSTGNFMPTGGFPLGRLRTEFDRLFDDFFRGWGGLPAWSPQRESGWGLDVDEQDDKIVVRAEAPGFEPDDFDLKVQNNQLMLCACQSEESKEDGGRQWHQQELYRAVTLPSGIDEEHVDAQYRNGVLTVTLPKTEQGKSRHIEVKA
jgi:HSP20 family protein